MHSAQGCAAQNPRVHACKVSSLQGGHSMSKFDPIQKVRPKGGVGALSGVSAVLQDYGKHVSVH